MKKTQTKSLFILLLPLIPIALVLIIMLASALPLPAQQPLFHLVENQIGTTALYIAHCTNTGAFGHADAAFKELERLFQIRHSRLER